MKPPRAALYFRVSTRDQHHDLQLDELRAVASQRGWRVIGEYVDTMSGAIDRRPQLDLLMADVARGRVDVVACWRFDRFARSVRHLVTALEEFRSLRVDFVSVRDSVDTSTPQGRFTFTIFAAVAELERELIRERTIAGVAAARRRGARLGRPPTAFNLLEAREQRAAGRSFRAIARDLGVPLSTLQRALAVSDPKPSSLQPANDTQTSGDR